jgi:hypothetical protein
VGELKVENTRHPPSLIPYLDASYGGFYLQFSLISQDLVILERTPLPFSVISDSDPLARLLEAEFLSDAGSPLKKVFVLVQRDQYLLTKDDLGILNNGKIVESWQEAFSFHAGENKAFSLIILANQINEEGRLRPLQSLFYCKTRKLFFHPPCPKCGLFLHQCENDGLLTHSGLQPYSSSLKRYLYCPCCFSESKPAFYVYELDRADPPTIKDRWALIKEYGLLPNQPNDPFPCGACPNHQECYGPDQRVLSRIYPFSFYPFYLFAFDATSLNGSDFLSLISGATFDELEAQREIRQGSGRARCLKAIKQDGLAKAPFFYNNDKKYFLEVLYLKLSFLAEVIQNLLRGTDLSKHPDLRVSIDRIWVKLVNPGGLIPFFWNFRVGFLDITRYSPEIQPSISPSSNTFFFLALVWFHALLANKKQDVSNISISLRESLDHPFSDQNFSKPLFNPLNIFWDPEGKTFHKDWLSLWEKSLLLGWSLFKASLRYDVEWSIEEFLKQLEELREEVKKVLFSKKPIVSLHAGLLETNTEDGVIHGILARIVQKWRAGMEVEKEEWKETIVLSPEGLKKESGSSLREEKENEIIPETVILSAPGAGLGLEEKETAKEGGRLSSPRKIDELPTGEDFSVQTVILRSGKGLSLLFGEVPSKEFGLQKKALLSGEAQTNVTPKIKEELPEDDVLSETVILGRGKVRERKRDGKKE